MAGGALPAARASESCFSVRRSDAMVLIVEDLIECCGMWKLRRAP